MRPDARIVEILDEQIAWLENSLDQLRRLRVRYAGDPSTPRDVPLAEADFSTRVYKCLQELEPAPRMLSEVAARSRGELMRLVFFGRKSYVEVWKTLVAHGLWSRTDKARQP